MFAISILCTLNWVALAHPHKHTFAIVCLKALYNIRTNYCAECERFIAQTNKQTNKRTEPNQTEKKKKSYHIAHKWKSLDSPKVSAIPFTVRCATTLYSNIRIGIKKQSNTNEQCYFIWRRDEQKRFSRTFPFFSACLPKRLKNL